MRDMVSERIIQLGCAYEHMVQASDIMEQMDRSKHVIEKISYETINVADKTLNLSREGCLLVDNLKKCFCTDVKSLSDKEQQQVTSFLDKLTLLMEDIKQTAAEENVGLHMIEKEVACHWDLTEELRDKLNVVSDSINQATACAEMILTMDL